MTISNELLPGVPLVESPLFAQSLENADLTDTERAIAAQLNERGYAVMDFPDPDFDERAERIKHSLAPRFAADFGDPEAPKNVGECRVQDAWSFAPDVKAIAVNAHVLALLGKIYGRRAFPFQTLNFSVGTQQHLHSDSIHFSSIPERFMCGVWVALEDIHADAGPLTYLPGSHKWPILSNTMIGERGWQRASRSAQTPYERAWTALVEANGGPQETFLARKGQALIWAANLLHGGSQQIDGRLTRWSQVTHYYFADCLYYTPAFSDEPLGLLDLRMIRNIETGVVEPNRYLGSEIPLKPDAADRSLIKDAKRWLRERSRRFLALSGNGVHSSRFARKR